MDGEFYTEDQLQNLELEQISDQYNKLIERVLAAMDKYIDKQIKLSKENFSIAEKKIDSIIYELQRD